MLLYWYRYSHDNIRITTETDDDSIGAHFLHMLHGGEADEISARVMDVSLILYAEHEFNASTFTARVAASTLTDLHSCVTAAIGSLRGPLHGGANEAAMDMIEQYSSAEAAVADVKRMLAAKELIMGFGHAVYRVRDPRNEIIKEWSQKLSELKKDPLLYEVSEAVERHDEGRKEHVCQRGFLPRQRLQLPGHPDAAVHADLRDGEGHRLVRARVRAACEQPHHPPGRRLHRSVRARLRTDRKTMTTGTR